MRIETKGLLMLGLLALLSGCAHDPAPLEQLRLSEQALQQAYDPGVPATARALQSAEQKLARARKNMAEEDFKRARVLAEQAELDARLAQAQQLSVQSEAELDVLLLQLQRLRKQLSEVN